MNWGDLRPQRQTSVSPQCYFCYSFENLEISLKKKTEKIHKLDTFFSKKPFNSDTLEFRAIYIKRKRDHDEIDK